jgi:AAA domain
MTLKTRKPTGAVPWPLILIEGGEKSGKSYACAVLSASARVGRTLWLDLNEGAADEYGAVPGARYEVIEHDGSWPSIIAQVTDAKTEAARAAKAGEKPVVLVVDSMTAEWDLLKAWADSRARKTDSNKRKLERDPNAEIQISMNFWNDANSRHRQLMTTLMTFPGIVVVTARGKDVAALDDGGRPKEGVKEYRVEGNKNLGYDASCWVRMFRDKPAIVVGARSVHAGIRPGKDEPQALDPDWTLEGLIFDALKCDPSAARVRDMAELRPDVPEGWTFDAAMAASAKAADRDACVTLWRESATAAKAEACTGREAETVQRLLAARMETLKAEAALALLDDGDPWLTASQAIASPEDAEKIHAEFADAFGNVDNDNPRKAAIGTLLGKRRGEVALYAAHLAQAELRAAAA